MRVRAGSCDVACEVVGTGTPIVLIHGLGASTALWSRLRGTFDGGHQVVLYDLRGAGGTRELEQRPLTLQTWTDDLRDLLGELGIERPMLVGHSLGGAIALKYAMRFPDDVEGLILMATEANLSNLGPRMTLSAERIARLGLERWADEFWSTNPPFAPGSLARDPSMQRDYRAMLVANDPHDYIRTCEAIIGAEALDGSLGAVEQRALVLVGAEDDRTVPAHGRDLATRLRNGTVIEFAGVGHTLPLEAPEQVGAAIVRFLAEGKIPESVAEEHGG